MKFNKTFTKTILKEWRYYAVDYKGMKKVLKTKNKDHDDFFNLYELAKVKLNKFYMDKYKWALAYLQTIEDKVRILRQTEVSSLKLVGSSEVETNVITSDSSHTSTSSIASEKDDARNIYVDIGSFSNSFGPLMLSSTKTSGIDCNCHRRLGSIEPNGINKSTISSSSASQDMERFSLLKEEYHRVGKSQHFQNYIYTKKSLDTYKRELDLVLEFLELNCTAFSKILKKYDKKNGSAIREVELAELFKTHSYLKGEQIRKLRHDATKILDEVRNFKPHLPDGFHQRKVYTIGCFDLFHRGHQNILMSLREFGNFIVAGIHDDASYFELKGKYTIDNLETRIKNTKPFVDQIFVIPSTNPELYLKSMVSEQDILTGRCCYARGDDMLQFPGREWVENVMPIHFVPRTECCSSSLIRTIYHADDAETREKAAFTSTRYDGKPIDESGNVLES